MRRTRPLTIKVQAQLCETFSRLLDTGFTLAQALDYGRALRPREAERLSAVAAVLAEGGGVDVAFAAGGFNPVVCTQVGLAGQHGDLAAALSALGTYLSLLETTRNRLGQLMAYPITLLLLLTALQAGIVYWVLPQLTTHTGQKIWPQIVLCLGSLLGLILMLAIVRRLHPRRRYQLLRRLPLIGGMLRRYYQYEFVLGASSFLHAGRDLADYCTYLADHDQGPLADLGAQVADAVERGEPLRLALTQPLVPLGFVQLAEMGQTPNLFGRSVATYARGLFTDLERQMTRLLAFVQPALFLVLGVQIVGLYAQLLLPLYSVIGGE